MKIGNINNIKDNIQENDFKIKKKFGQNFLTDQNILSKIVQEAKVDKNTNVIEVGPGLGSLTEHIAEAANSVLVYEIDKEIMPILRNNLSNYHNVEYVLDDILNRNIDEDIETYFQDDKDVIFISNLPYYITTTILMKFLEESKIIKRMVCMMQLEVAQRVTSDKKSKDYNSLSIAIKYKADVSLAFKVSKNVFIPKPNVDSAVVRFEIRDYPIKPINEELFYKLIRMSFAQRRKTLVNNLKTDYPRIQDILSSINIDLMSRAEDLSIDDFIKISDILTE